MSFESRAGSTEEPKTAGLVDRIEAGFDAKRRELGVEDELKGIHGTTTLMLVAFGDNGIRTVEDLANCSTDELLGWNEMKDGKEVRFPGILDHFGVSREDCDAMIISARIMAGWIDEPKAVTPKSG